MNCAEADTFVHAFVDGELAGVDRDSYEQHLLECDTCSHAGRLQSRFKAAVRGHLSRPAVPLELVSRIESAVRTAPPIRRRYPWEAYPRLAPAAAAAVVLVTVMGLARGHRSPVVMEQAARAYHAAMPMDVVDSDCASIVNWFRGKVDFTVPDQMRPLGSCQGGRLMNVQDRFAAYLIYQVPGGHRLAVLVYPGDEEDVEAPDRRTMDGHSVYFGRGRGVSSAAFRNNDGLNYVVTSDVSEDTLGGLVQAVLTERR